MSKFCQHQLIMQLPNSLYEIPQRHGGFCLETQVYPDAVNHDNFPGVILSPGQVYTHVCKYKFSCKK